MNKFSALLLALVMAVSVNVFAAAETATLGADTNVNGHLFTHGTVGVPQEGTFAYPNPVTVNGVSYPAGTQFQVIQIGNTMVPVATSTGGALAVGGTAAVGGGIAGGLSTLGTVGTIAAVGALGALATNQNNTAATVTATVTQ